MIKGLRGVISGTDVKRFKLIDTTGFFPVYTFEINPTSYVPLKDNEFVGTSVSISGRKVVMSFPRSNTSKELRWDRISRTMYKELEKRYKSGRTFILRDHNYQAGLKPDPENNLLGKIKEFNFEEITATVPSAYKGGFVFEGVGKG